MKTKVIFLSIAMLTLKAADIPERICRSPKLHDFRKVQLYSKAAQVMGTTCEVIEKVSMLKEGNHNHIMSIANPENTDEFEYSRKILSYEVLAVANENLKFWLDFCERSITNHKLLKESYARS